MAEARAVDAPHPSGPSVAVQALPIALCALGAFSVGVGMRVLDPLLPPIAAEFGRDVAGATIAIAAFMLPYALVQIVAGPLGDRLGKPRVACVAVLVHGAVFAAGALAEGFWGFVALRALAGLVAGAVAPLLIAHIGDSVPYARRQAALGRFLTGMVMAQLLTGPIAGIIAEFAGWRVVFAAFGAFGLAAGLAIAVWLGGGLVRAAAAPPARGLAGYGVLLRRPGGRRLLLLAAGDGACLFGGAFPFVGAFAIEAFGRSAAEAGLIVAGFGLGSLLYTRTARWLVGRLGERRLLLAGGAGLAVGLLGLAAAPHWAVLAVAQVWLGFAFFMFHGVLQTRATEAMPEARGTAVSAFALALFLGQAAGSVVFGLLLPWVGYGGGFAAAAAGVLALAWSAAAAPQSGGPPSMKDNRQGA